MQNKLSKLFILGILLVTIPTIGQEFIFDIHSTNLLECLSQEQNLSGERIEPSSRHASFNGEAQPIKFLRQEEVIPDLTVFYFFKELDSIMTYILYEWDLSNFEKKDNNQQTEAFQNAIIEKYQALKKEISSDYGEPKTESNYSNIAKLDPDNLFEESSIWSPNDSLEIYLYSTASNYYEKRNSLIINPVHRIRLYVRNTSKEKENAAPKLDEVRIKELEKITTEYLAQLKAKKFDKSKNYLAEFIKEAITEDQLNMLVEIIDLDQDPELFYSGTQLGFDGSTYAILQFKYSEEATKLSAKMLKMVFDSENKIVGIQPIN